MAIRVETSIKKYNKGYSQYDANIINQIFDFGGNSSLKINSLIVKDIEVDFNNATLFTKNISEIGGDDFDNYSMLSIFSKEVIESPTDMGVPVRFDLEIHPGVTITTSQFLICNSTSINWNDVTIKNLQPNENKKTLLTIVIGKI